MKISHRYPIIQRFLTPDEMYDSSDYQRIFGFYPPEVNLQRFFNEKHTRFIAGYVVDTGVLNTELGTSCQVYYENLNGGVHFLTKVLPYLSLDDINLQKVEIMDREIIFYDFYFPRKQETFDFLRQNQTIIVTYSS